MPVNIRPVTGGHKGQSPIRQNVTNVPSVLSSAPRDVLQKPMKDILFLIFFTVRGVAFAPKNARGKQ